MKGEIILTAAIWFFTIIFFILSCIRSRRIRILPSFFILISVTFFSILSPFGEVLLTIGSLKITAGALLLGLRRSGLLIGMVFLSRILISPQSNKSFFNNFGKLGSKLTEVFFWLNLLTEKKISLKRGHIIEALDERLCEIWKQDSPESMPNSNGNDDFYQEVIHNSTKPEISFDISRGPCNG